MSEQPRRKGRETLLSVMLAVVLGALFFFFLNIISLGVFFHVTAAILAIMIVGYLHYLLWGHTLSQEVAGERAMEKLKEEMEEDGELEYDERVRRVRDEYYR